MSEQNNSDNNDKKPMFNMGPYPESEQTNKKPAITKTNKSAKDNVVMSDSKIKRFIIITVAFSLLAGYGGGYYAARTYSSNSGGSNQVSRQVIDNEGQLITGIAKGVGESVVSIDVKSETTQRSIFGGSRSYTEQSAGTGFIIDADKGIVITNRHVIPSGTSSVEITMSDGTKLSDVEVIGRTSDSDTLDVAFLKIKDRKGKTLKAVTLGDSSAVNVGARVVAIGNALGQFQNTVTSGIISGYGRSLEAGDSSGSSTETLQNMFQTDASINQGNSGGPLVDMGGNVIGINTAVASGGAENIGFSIPINDVKGLIDGVIKQGKLLRPYLGVRYVTLTDDYAYQFNLNIKRGAYIAPSSNGQPSIIKDSPADKAGLKEKDIITKVNDQEIDEKNSLVSVLGKYSVGDKVTLTVHRDGQDIKIDVTLEAAPQN